MNFIKACIFILATISTDQVSGQYLLSGNVKDTEGTPLPFASVYLDETFEGSATDEKGNFQLSAKTSGSYTLVVSAMGYETKKQTVELNLSSQSIDLKIAVSGKVLGSVVISAGSFAASVEAKSALLKPLDIVTNAGAQGDIYKALETLPGVSKVGDETGIFVRGGDAHETKTIIDGTLVSHPFFGDTPNLASRSRFDPFMFKGTTFTTGGYSAEYGGALSSVLLLDTEDIPEFSSTSLGLNMAGATLAHQHVWNQKTAIIADVSYNNLNLLVNSVPQNIDWEEAPEGLGTKWAFRHQTKKGMIKSFVQHQRGDLSLYSTNLESESTPHHFSNDNLTTYWNTNYQGVLSDKLFLYAGFAFNENQEDLVFDSLEIREDTRMYHAKTTLTYDINEQIVVKGGMESFVETQEQEVVSVSKLSDNYSAAFIESDVPLGKRLAFRLGVRAEYSSLLDQTNIAPRTSMAYKTGEDSQISLAYGIFHQKPESDYLFDYPGLEFENARHLIANYQWTTNERAFRLELYDKRYESLTKKEGELLTNRGNGYSRGIDLFWKDEKSIENLNYWVSYSYLDAKRDYKDYPVEAIPTFVTNHTMSVVANYSLDHLGISPGLTYTYASGRRYYNPNNPEYLSDQTKDYHNLSFTMNYITEVLGNFTVLYASLTNPFGFDQVFGYNYSNDGSTREAIRPSAQTTFFLGLFINFRK